VLKKLLKRQKKQKTNNLVAELRAPFTGSFG